ncbi:DUF4373 domain-containing protein [bacterium 1xD42-62]|uniref:DUF4373 domain-containing protein n=2 Tax=Parablautia muri TaxID=2320879 RepID=A0A9X5BFS2_9FIRM|nr:DUF4373 domain-containing protein [Parablautia muri]
MAMTGINSFLLDCRTNDNISEVEGEFGVKGFAVVVRLWQKIYSEKGYYCEWTERSPVLFLSNWFGGDSGVTLRLINEVVKRCLSNGIFDAGMYQKYSVLTSARIQTQYFNVVKRREQIPVIKEYLLVSVGKIRGIVYENDVSVCRNQKNACRNGTSKVKESKEKNKDTMCTLEKARALFEELWKLYPCKKGKGKVSDTQKIKLLKIGYDEMERAIGRYVSYVKSISYLNHQNGSTFFNSGYIDYLDADYVEDKKPVKQTGQFVQFMQQDYDFEQLEREILSN